MFTTMLYFKSFVLLAFPALSTARHVVPPPAPELIARGDADLSPTVETAELIPRAKLAARGDDEILADWSIRGACYYYTGTTAKNTEKSFRPCKIYCPKTFPGTNPEMVGCKGPTREFYRTSLDEEGLEWTEGTCLCPEDLAFAGAILDIVVEALGKLDDVICGVMIKALEVFVNTALDVIPGGQVAKAVPRLVEGAKTMVENGLSESSFFDDWIRKDCGGIEINVAGDLGKIFTNIVTSSDDVGKSKGCKQKNKPTTAKPTSEPPKATTTEPKPTTTDQATTTATSQSSAGACKKRLQARADGLVEAKLGEDMTSEECNNGVMTVHITSTQKKIGSYLTTIGKACRQDWTQACYHYRSVMSVHTATESMHRWTCHATKGTSKAGQTTEHWGALAINTMKGQHWFPWMNGFIARSPKGKVCEKDEWPPRYFWPGDKEALKRNMKQRVRLLPQNENGGAGSMWAHFCEDNNAQTVKNKPGTTYVNPSFIQTVKSESKQEVNKGTTTIKSTVSVDTAHAVFTITDFQGIDLNDKLHGLKENPCWPKALAGDDPGFVLLTDDEYYATQPPSVQARRLLYKGYPDLAELVKAVGGANHALDAAYNPPYQGDQTSSIDQAVYEATFIKHKNLKKPQPIPDMYLWLLPGMPRPAGTPPDVRQRLPAWNETDWEALEEVYDEDEVRRWMEEYYMEMVRRSYYESPNVVAPETEAVATPAGQGGPTAMATATVVGSDFSGMLPRETGA
ncbi:hypothetical protein QBC34DRAFT_363987 [Podospora aff. communis PSN243]|uniref:Uncharacterized protein n=1 Tax=Podospora aff. communis PSN243 TaxID=3040156 RepID=A0AAV9G283_9PEZI|nr:hypothetical protein QBC34DRAFT_363987 [Podospora aff. communis PSN243]